MMELKNAEEEFGRPNVFEENVCKFQYYGKDSLKNDLSEETSRKIELTRLKLAKNLAIYEFNWNI